MSVRFLQVHDAFAFSGPVRHRVALTRSAAIAEVYSLAFQTHGLKRISAAALRGVGWIDGALAALRAGAELRVRSLDPDYVCPRKRLAAVAVPRAGAD